MKLKHRPSKELIKEVKKVTVLEFVDFCPEDSICIKYDNKVKVGNHMIVAKDGGVKTFELHKLMVECKKWAIKQGFYLETRYIQEFKKWRCILHYEKNGLECTVPTFIPLEDNELEIVFEACNWITERKDKVL